MSVAVEPGDATSTVASTLPDGSDQLEPEANAIGRTRSS